jgi:hypothetical protein
MATITTTYGDMDESLLEKKTGDVDNENEATTWTEYYLTNPDGTVELVHRSVHVRLKKNLSIEGVAANF